MNNEQGGADRDAVILRSHVAGTLASPPKGALARRGLQLLPSLRERAFHFPPEAYRVHVRLNERLHGFRTFGSLTISHGGSSRSLCAAGEIFAPPDSHVGLILNPISPQRPESIGVGGSPSADADLAVESFLAALSRLDPWSIDEVSIYGGQSTWQRKHLRELVRGVTAQKGLRRASIGLEFEVEDDYRDLLAGFATLPLLTELSLSRLSDQLMPALVGVEQVRRLELWEWGGLTGSGLAALARLPFLDTLELAGGSPIALSPLSAVRTLRNLYVEFGTVPEGEAAPETPDEGGILAIACLPSIEEIGLIGQTVGSATAGALADLGYDVLADCGPRRLNTFISRRTGTGAP